MSSDKRTPMEKLLGSELLTKVGSKHKTNTLLADKEFVLLYFSASWCPPCKAFSPILTQFYKKFAKKEHFEVVFVSSDRSVESFNGYYSKMPFLAIPTDPGLANLKNNLAYTLQIQSIPTLIVLRRKDAYFVTDNARNEISQLKSLDHGLELIKSWRAKEAVPIDQAEMTRDKPKGPMDALFKIVIAILKNPVYIFAMLFAWKMYVKPLIFPERAAEEAESETLAGQQQEDGTGTEF